MNDVAKLMQTQADLQGQKKLLDMLQKTNKSQRDMIVKVANNLTS